MGSTLKRLFATDFKEAGGPLWSISGLLLEQFLVARRIISAPGCNAATFANRLRRDGAMGGHLSEGTAR